MMSQQEDTVTVTLEAVWKSWNRAILIYKNNNNNNRPRDDHRFHEISNALQHLRNTVEATQHHPSSWTTIFRSMNTITPQQVMISLIGAANMFLNFEETQQQQHHETFQYNNDCSLSSSSYNHQNHHSNLAYDTLDVIIKILQKWDVSFIYESFLGTSANTVNHDHINHRQQQQNDESQDLFRSLYRLLTKTRQDNNTKMQGYILQIFDTWRHAVNFVVGKISSGINSSSNHNNYGYHFSDENDHHCWDQIAKIAIDYVLSFDDKDGEFYNGQASAVSLLASLFKMDKVSGSLLFWKPQQQAFPGLSQEDEEDNQNSNDGSENDGDTISKLCSHLLLNIQNLNDTNSSSSSSSSFYHLGLVSFSLLSLIRHKDSQRSIQELDTLVRSTNIIENITRLALRVNKNIHNNWSSEGYAGSEPRWISETRDICVRRAALDILCNLNSISQGEGWGIFIERMEPYYEMFCQDTWKCILEGCGTASGDRELNDDDVAFECALRGLLLLHTSDSCRPTVHNVLAEVLSVSGHEQHHHDVAESSPCQKLLMSLFSFCSHHSFTVSVSASVLLNNFLTLRKNNKTHDDLSRSVWNAIDLRTTLLLESLMKVASNLSTSHAEEGCNVRLACIMNTIDSLLSTPSYSEKVILEKDLGKRYAWVELVNDILVKGKFSGVEKNQEDEHESGILMQDEDTPKMGNLESNKCHAWPNQNKCILPECSDGSRLSMVVCRLVSATVLARIAYLPQGDITDDKEHNMLDQLTLVQAKARSSLHEFLLTIPSIITHRPCQTIRQCLTRLYTAVALSSEENESLVTFVMSDLDWNRSQKLEHKQGQLEDFKKKLEKMTHQKVQLTLERDGYKNQLLSTKVAHERDVHRIRQRATADALRLVDVHATERSRATARAHELAQQTSQAEAKMQKAELAAQTIQESLDHTKGELCDAKEKMKKLEQMLQEKCDLVNDYESRNAEMSRDIITKQEELHAAKKLTTSLHESLSHAEESLSEATTIQGQLKDDLENTFSDLISLAHVYKAREKDIANLKEENISTANNLKQKVEAQRSQKEEFEDVNLRLARESERLQRKLARSKEKLEEERRERKQEQERRKRNGPVSYMNQLHDDSMISVKKTGRERSMRERSIYSEKENDYSTSHQSSSSRRRINR